MFRFYDVIISPVIHATKPARILEVGALGGENTKNICTTFSDAEVMVVDPVPSFDIGSLQSELNNMKFYKDLSLNVIPEIGRFDVGIIDGDHNWYTVYNELKLIESSHGASARDFPVLIFHDISWPYGRRDLYYNHTTIPDEFCHPHAKKGIAPGKRELVNDGGLNKQLNNALLEGGEKNGVLTAIEDFIAESDIDFIFKKIQVYFGFGILISKERLNSSQSLQKELDNLFSAERMMEIIAVQEKMLIMHMIRLQNILQAGEN